MRKMRTISNNSEVIQPSLLTEVSWFAFKKNVPKSTGPEQLLIVLVMNCKVYGKRGEKNTTILVTALDKLSTHTSGFHCKFVYM